VGEGIDGPQQDPVVRLQEWQRQLQPFRARARCGLALVFLSRLREGDEIARIITFLFAASVVLITLLLVFELWQGSVLPRHKFGFNFFRTSVWTRFSINLGPSLHLRHPRPALVSLLMPCPLGIGAAIFLAELAPPRISDTLEFFIDLLAAVPSVIYGLLGVFVVIPLMREYIQPRSRTRSAFCRFSRGRCMAGLSHCWDCAGHHGHSLHHFRFA